MQIKLIAVGTKMPDWVKTGFEEYNKRLAPKGKIQVVEIPLEKRSKNADVVRMMNKEGDAMLAATKDDDWVIALAINGKSYSTEQFADQLSKWQHQGQNIVFYVGGPEGLAKQCLARANQKLSFSEFTLPHPLVRIVLAEQVYRASSLLAGHPYHK